MVKTGIAIVSAIAAIAAVILAVMWKAPSPVPRYSWVQTRSQTFVLNAGSWYAFGPIHRAAPSPLVRYDLHSSLPVDTGIIPLTDGQVKLDEDWTPGTSPCYDRGVLDTQETCRPQTEDSDIWVHDARDPGGLPVAGLMAAIAGVRKPLNDQLLSNRVTLDVYAWQCLANCPK